jgi:integrase
MSPSFWPQIATLSGLPNDVTPHVFRHTFASIANDLSYSEPTIAALIGHKGRTMTSRYIHSADAVLLAAADAIADRIVTLMDAGLTQRADTDGEPAVYNAVTP